MDPRMAAQGPVGPHSEAVRLWICTFQHFIMDHSPQIWRGQEWVLTSQAVDYFVERERPFPSSLTPFDLERMLSRTYDERERSVLDVWRDEHGISWLRFISLYERVLSGLSLSSLSPQLNQAYMAVNVVMRDPTLVPDVWPGHWKLLNDILGVAVDSGIIGPLHLDRESSEFLAIKLCLDSGPGGPLWQRWIYEPGGVVHLRKLAPVIRQPGIGYIFG